MTGRITPLVLLQVVAVYLALPVDVPIGGNLAARLNARQVTRPTWTVLIEEQLGGAGFPHLVEHFTEMVGTVEEEHQHGDICLEGLFHIITIIGHAKVCTIAKVRFYPQTQKISGCKFKRGIESDSPFEITAIITRRLLFRFCYGMQYVALLVYHIEIQVGLVR